MVQAAFANLVQTMVCWPWSSFGGGVRPQRRQRCSFTDRESFVTNELCTAGDGHERVVCTDIAKTTADAACGSASSSRAVIGAQSATLLGSESELIPTPVSMAELVVQRQQLQQGASVADADFLGQQTRHAHLIAPADPKLMGERLGETAADLGRMLSRQSQSPRRVLEATPAATDSPSPVLVSGPTDHTPRGKPASVVPSVVKGRGYTSPSMPMVHSIHHMGYSATRLPMRASLGPPCALGTASSLLPMHAAHAQASLPQRSPSTPPGQPAGTFYQI